MPLLGGAQPMRGNTDERLLAAHNRERAAVGVAALAWNPQLAASAADWASKLSKNGRPAHKTSAAAAYGENLWLGGAGRFAPEAMVGAWLDEKSRYRHGRFPQVSTTGDWADVGHYTQIVWRGTGEVGCGIGRGEAYDVLVCRYRRAGNRIGQVPY